LSQGKQEKETAAFMEACREAKQNVLIWLAQKLSTGYEVTLQGRFDTTQSALK
jgi:hypothetical protein